MTLLAVVIGCVASVQVDIDPDQDGLLDSEEAAYGSDPGLPDTDADGWEDGAEVTSYTDPTDAADMPYELGWRIDACRNDVEGTGYGEGDVVQASALTDQLEETVRVHDFCDQVVLLDFSAGWCGACQAEAPELQSFFEEREDDGFMALTVYMENVDGSAPTLGEAQDWSDAYGLQFPVLVDDGSFYDSFASATGSSTIGLPLMVLIDRGMVVTMSEGASTGADADLLGD